MARGFQVRFSVPELQQAIQQIGAYDGRTALKIESAVQASTQAVTAGEKSRVSVRTGALKKKIRSRFDRRTITGTIAAKSPYAHLVEFGAKAAVEKPKNRKALKIGGKGKPGGFAKRVNIPARRPRPFARPAFEAEKPTLIRNIKKAVQP